MAVSRDYLRTRIYHNDRLLYATLPENVRSVFSIGTPKGVGFVKKPAIYLQHGDDIRVWIDSGFGTLINTVIEEGKALPAKAKL